MKGAWALLRRPIVPVLAGLVAAAGVILFAVLPVTGGEAPPFCSELPPQEVVVSLSDDEASTSRECRLPSGRIVTETTEGSIQEMEPEPEEPEP